MKKVFNLLPVVGGALAMLMSVSSCSDKMDEEIVSSNPADQVPSEVVAKLDNLGFNTEGIKMDGANFLVEGDMIITPEAFAELGEQVVSVPGPAGEEQYRTSNLVNCNGSRTIRVRCDLTGARSTGVDWAIANYNALGLCLNFQRVYSGSADITFYNTSGSGGSAGFPSGGNPYNRVYLGSGLASYGNNVCEHVATHEMGHCLGFRHTDYFNRAYSCGSGGNEGSAGVGANHI
ncbi:MAG: M57 family metalloprotease, partial [Cyclobacteriaceae bacterium]